MHYAFPKITHLDDVLPAIKGRDEFVVADRDAYTVVNYNVGFVDTFPPVETVNDALRRECRGIIFDGRTGKIIARRPHKFFNVNERNETTLDMLDFSRPHRVLTKHDGSLITPFMTSDGELRWGTKMGETDVAEPVVDFINKNRNYIGLAQGLIHNRITPFFEWCSRKNRIVLDYPEDRLVLLGAREMVTGEYINLEELRPYENAGIEVVNYHNVKADDPGFLNWARSLDRCEGFVIRWDDGHMVKIKTDEYTQLHKTLSYLSFEKDVLKLILDEMTDDIKPILNKDVKKQLEEYESRVLKHMADYAHMIYRNVKEWVDEYGSDRKEFATKFVCQFDSDLKPLFFKTFNDGKNILGPQKIFDEIKKAVYKKTGSQSNVDQVRNLIGHRNQWVYGKT